MYLSSAITLVYHKYTKPRNNKYKKERKKEKPQYPNTQYWGKRLIKRKRVYENKLELKEKHIMI